MTTIEKIKDLLAQKNMSAYKLSLEIGLNKTFLTDWTSGKAKPSADALSKIADYFDVSVDYLLGRTENRNYFPNTNELPKDYEPKYAIPHTQSDLLDIPILGSICAGNGIIADEHIDGYEPTSRHSLNGHPSSDFYWLRVEGDSMEPFFFENDLVLVRRQTSVDSGSIAAVLIDGEEGVIKRVEYGRDWIELISENPIYSTRRFEGADVQRVYILGLIVESKRKIAR